MNDQLLGITCILFMFTFAYVLDTYGDSLKYWLLAC